MLIFESIQDECYLVFRKIAIQEECLFRKDAIQEGCYSGRMLFRKEYESN
jgi:hypothetical protein